MGFSRTQRAFTSGEIAPALYGRADLVAFASGLATCRNFFVRRHGGVTNRPGSRYIASVKDSSTRTYLFKFVYSTSQTFVIEAGNLYFRFFAQGAVIGAPYELATPYISADLSALVFRQSGNVVTITHPSYAPRELRRVTDTNWTLTTVTTAPSISAPTGLAWTVGSGTAFSFQYQVTAIASDDEEESLPCAAVAHSCDAPTPATPNSLTWSTVTGAKEYDVYLSREGNAFGYIGTTIDPNFADVGLIPDLSYPPPSARVLFAAANDYPRTSGYLQQRRWFASSNNEPSKVWGSRIGAPANFAVSSPLQDDDGVTFELAGNQVNNPRHFEELAGQPVVLAERGVWVLSGDENGSVTPTAIYPRRLSHRGCAAVSPVMAGDALVYPQDRSSAVRALRLGQNAADDDLTLFAPHLMERYGLERLDYAELPDSVLWAVRADGTLLSCTYQPEQSVIGWGRHDTVNGYYEDVVCVPEGNEDAVYVIVRRGNLRSVERFASRRVTDIEVDAIFLDSYLTYSGTATTTVSGLGHLIGQTVGVLADGNVVAQRVVSGAGTVTLPEAASVVHVGLPITADIETLDLDLAELELRDKRKQLASVSLLIESSRGILAGPDADHLYELKPDGITYTAGPTVTTGLVEIPITANWAVGARILVRQRDPLPLTILAVIPNGEAGG